DGPLLRERSAPDLDRLVRPAAPPARLPCLNRRPHLPVRAGDRLVRLLAPALPADRLLSGDVLPGGDHPHRELRLPELHRAQPRRAAGGRPFPSPEGSRGETGTDVLAGARRAGVDLVFDRRARPRDLALAARAAALASHRPGALSDREPLRAVRGD